MNPSRRRSPPAVARFATIADEMSVIEALRVEAVAGVESRAPAATKEMITRLARRLRARLSWEERVLFPTIERELGEMHAFARLRRQHAVVRELLAGIGGAVGRGEWARANGDLRELGAALRAHDAEERRVVVTRPPEERRH